MNQGTPLKIYCLNLRSGYIREERDGRENMIRTRQFRVDQQIKQYDPDVIAFQECTSGWRAVLEDGILDDYEFSINGPIQVWRFSPAEEMSSPTLSAGRRINTIAWIKAGSGFRPPPRSLRGMRGIWSTASLSGRS